MGERIEYRTEFDYSDTVRRICEQANRLIDEQVVEQVRGRLAELGYRKCSECEERQGYYLDAETIQRQQEHIAKLEREGAAAFYDVSYTRDALRQRDELIREILKALSAECKPYRINGLPEQVAYFKAKARNIGCEVD